MNKAIKIFLLFLSITILSSCWDAREINELGLVTAVAIDKTKNGKNESKSMYTVTVQIANPGGSGGASGNGESGGAAKSKAWTATVEGESIFEAIRELIVISSKRAMWAYNNIVIIGESLARESIAPVVDFFSHNQELRLKALIAVSKGDAKDCITVKAGLEEPSGLSFEFLEYYRKYAAESVDSSLLNVLSDLKHKHSNPLISCISIRKGAVQPEGGSKESEGGERSGSEDEGEGEGEGKGESGKDEGGKKGEKESEILELKGAGVFNGDKLIGWLSDRETLGYSWINNQTKNTIVTVTDPEHENKSVSVETQKVKSKVKSEIKDGKPEFTIMINGMGEIVEEDGYTELDLEEVKKNVSKLVNERISEDVNACIDVIQKEYKTDVLGLARFAHSQNKKEWKEGLSDEWEDIFPEVTINVSVNIKIYSSALNQEPLHKIK